MLTLEAKKREKGAVVPEGQMVAVFYGKTTPSTPVTISLSDFKKVWEEAGESTVVTIGKANKAATDNYIKGTTGIQPASSVPPLQTK